MGEIEISAMRTFEVMYVHGAGVGMDGVTSETEVVFALHIS